VSYNRQIMALQELTVERYEGVADDQRILLLRGPITIETAPHFDRAVRHESAETMIVDLSTRWASVRWWRPTYPIRRWGDAWC